MVITNIESRNMLTNIEIYINIRFGSKWKHMNKVKLRLKCRFKCSRVFDACQMIYRGTYFTFSSKTDDNAYVSSSPVNDIINMANLLPGTNFHSYTFKRFILQYLLTSWKLPVIDVYHCDNQIWTRHLKVGFRKDFQQCNKYIFVYFRDVS